MARPLPPSGSGARTGFHIRKNKWDQFHNEENLAGHCYGDTFPHALCLPEQRRIVAELDRLQTEADSLRTLQAETGSELRALMPSIVSRAFTGLLGKVNSRTLELADRL